MRAPSVVIIASPYEGELLGRSLAETGLRVLRADGGEGGHALVATELPLALVVGTTLFGADPAALVAEAQARGELAVFVLAAEDDPVADALRPRVREVLRRPIDFEALGHRIEKLAVDAERVEELDDLSLEIVEDRPDVPLPPARTQNVAAGAAEMLRADDGLGDELLRVDALAGLGFEEVQRGGARAFDNRSTIARAIDRELSQAERRLFPDHGQTPLPFAEPKDYEDALADIDLDALGIDTLPGLRGVAERPVEQPAATRPTSPPAREIQESGSLETTDVAELVGRLHRTAFSGALDISTPEGQETLYFDHGEPIGARSTLRHAHLAELLFRDGKLTRDQVTRLSSSEPATDARGFPRPVALRLVEERLLKESELFAVARRHLEEVLYSVFALQTGEYRLGPELPAADDRVRASTATAALVAEGVRRKYGLERLSAQVQRDAVLSPTTLFARTLDAAALTVEERRAALLFDGQRSVSDVRATLGRGTSESMLLAVAWMLVALGALEQGGEGVDLRNASTVVVADANAERRARPRTADPARLEADRAVDRERIAIKRAQVLDADYFAVLGVGRDATDLELERAHARLRADFDPAQLDAAVVAEQREALDEIVEVLDEALRVLRVPAIRARYAAHLPADGS